MPNIPVININGTDYNVKDTEARNRLNVLTDNIDNVRSALDNTLVPVDMGSNWEQGAINSSTGASTSNQTRIRSINYMKPLSALLLIVPVGYKAYWFKYSAANISGYIGSSGGWITENVYIPADGNYYKVCVAYTDNSNITPSAASNTPIIIYNPTDETLSLTGKSADAKTVGDLFKETPVFLDWEQGAQNTDTGGATPSTTRVRTNFYLKPINKIKIQIPTGYKMLYLRYTDGAISSYTEDHSSFTTGELILSDNNSFYKIVAAKDDDTDITPEDVKNIFGYDRITRPFLASTNDNTDRTSEIRSMLVMYGSVELGKGVFHTTGIIMRDDSKIIGNGTNTKLILDTGTYAIWLASRCTIENLDIAGNGTESTVWGDTIGDRHGIVFRDDSRRGFIINCNIHGFTGGGISLFDSGSSSSQGVNITGCNIWNCYAGINNAQYSEFHRFVGCCINFCRVAVICNGGNNVFNGCTFASNTDHFLLDNSQNDKRNNAHGICSGCNFQHSGYDKTRGSSGDDGNMITINNSGSGFIFDGCFLGDGYINIDTSYRITFTGCQCMEDVYLVVNGGGLVLFDGCEVRSSFEENTTITNNTAVKFANVYTSNGTLVDPTL